VSRIASAVRTGPLGVVAVRDGAPKIRARRRRRTSRSGRRALDLAANALVVRREERAHVLGVELLGRDVKPTMSTKRTLTTRRSSRCDGSPSAVPQWRQKRAISGFS
jgi:hypothetical protein